MPDGTDHPLAPRAPPDGPLHHGAQGRPGRRAPELLPEPVLDRIRGRRGTRSRRLPVDIDGPSDAPAIEAAVTDNLALSTPSGHRLRPGQLPLEDPDRPARVATFQRATSRDWAIAFQHRSRGAGRRCALGRAEPAGLRHRPDAPRDAHDHLDAHRGAPGHSARSTASASPAAHSTTRSGALVRQRTRLLHHRPWRDHLRNRGGPDRDERRQRFHITASTRRTGRWPRARSGCPGGASSDYRLGDGRARHRPRRGGAASTTSTATG